jgi:hypothetical protein
LRCRSMVPMPAVTLFGASTGNCLASTKAPSGAAGPSARAARLRRSDEPLAGMPSRHVGWCDGVGRRSPPHCILILASFSTGSHFAASARM